MRTFIVPAALCCLFSVSPVHAQSSRGAAVSAFRLVAAERVCPAYRINTVRLETELARYGISVDDLASEKFSKLQDEAVEEVKRDISTADGRKSFCNLMIDSFGPSGQVPGLFVRRD